MYRNLALFQILKVSSEKRMVFHFWNMTSLSEKFSRKVNYRKKFQFLFLGTRSHPYIYWNIEIQPTYSVWNVKRENKPDSQVGATPDQIPFVIHVRVLLPLSV